MRLPEFPEARSRLDRASAGPRFTIMDAFAVPSEARGQHIMAVARKKPAAPEQEPAPDLGKERELHAYREMLQIRRFEEKAGQMYGMGLIGGFCHLYIGQEAVVVGMQMAMKEGDQV